MGIYRATLPQPLWLTIIAERQETSPEVTRLVVTILESHWILTGVSAVVKSEMTYLTVIPPPPPPPAFEICGSYHKHTRYWPRCYAFQISTTDLWTSFTIGRFRTESKKKSDIKLEDKTLKHRAIPFVSQLSAYFHPTPTTHRHTHTNTHTYTCTRTILINCVAYLNENTKMKPTILYFVISNQNLN